MDHIQAKKPDHIEPKMGNDRSQRTMNGTSLDWLALNLPEIWLRLRFEDEGRGEKGSRERRKDECGINVDVKKWFRAKSKSTAVRVAGNEKFEWASLSSSYERIIIYLFHL